MPRFDDELIFVKTKINQESEGLHVSRTMIEKLNSYNITWQSSPLVRTSPLMYCLSSEGDRPKLLPMQSVSTRASAWLISTVPFRITYHRSSFGGRGNVTKV